MALGFERERERMVVEQLEARGIHDSAVLAAIRNVPRHRFVAPALCGRAYDDTPLPIGERQTISQPYMVALMTEAIGVHRGEHVLEVGTGSGYQAAVLAELARDVVTVERWPSLALTAREVLAELGYDNVTVVEGDASAGYPPGAPYDRILVTAASPRISPELARQCALEGRIVAPVGDEDLQQIVVRTGDGTEMSYGAVKFVPLRGRAGFPP